MNPFWRIFYVRMAEADAGEGGGAGAGDSGGAAADAGQGAAAGAGAADNGGAAAAGSVLANAGGEGQQSQAVAIPEKYQVKKEDGTVDIEASSLKLAEAYGHLEKRLGSGDAPPKTPEEYQITVPDALKDALDPKTDPLLGAFLKDAHAAGLSQKQIDLVMGKYFDLAPKLIEGSRQLSEAECIADLKNEWKDDATFKAEVGKAYKAVQAYGDKDAQAILAEYGNDPRVIRLMARVGAELGEDRSINPGGTLPGGQSVESLMTSEAYTNPKHADHARVSAQVQTYFNKQAEAQAKAGNVPIL
jgi:hypothetical protein